MQPLDPPLFGGATQAEPPDDGTAVLPKDSDVWYLHRSGAWQRARVIAVDETMLPAFYQIEMLEDGTVRDTERPRLRKRLPGAQVPPASDARGLSGASLPSATHLQPVAAGNGSTSTQVDGAVPPPSTFNQQTHPQSYQQPGVQSTLWSQQTSPNPPATPYMHGTPPGAQPYGQYPAQYPPAQMQGTSVAGAPYPYHQAHHSFVPSGHQAPGQWHSQQSWQQPQAFTGYPSAQMQPQHGNQPQWNAHQSQAHGTTQYYQHGTNFQNVGIQNSYQAGQVPNSNWAVPQTAQPSWQGQPQGTAPNPSFPGGGFTPHGTLHRK